MAVIFSFFCLLDMLVSICNNPTELQQDLTTRKLLLWHTACNFNVWGLFCLKINKIS